MPTDARMVSIPLWLTFELLQSIDHARGDVPRAVWIEETLRRAASVRAAQKELGLEWKVRPRPGKRAKRKEDDGE